MNNDKVIAVIGAGPGGLILARLLQMGGANVNVYERDFDKDARVQGSPLDMHEESGYKALNKAGLIEEFRKHVLNGADKKIVLNARAEVLFSDHDLRSAANIGETQSSPEISRGMLRRILMESLKPRTIVWDSHFISMEKHKSGWLLSFKNGFVAYADLVIAADGANSGIRPYITGVKAFYSGIIMLEINVKNAQKTTPRIHELLNGGKVMAFGNGRNILGGQKGGGDLGFYATFKAAGNWTTISGIDFTDRAQLLTWFHNEYSGWSSIWEELFQHAVMPVIPRPIYCMPLDQSWETQPNLTMIGDAAHVMPPFAGEGANMAMLDALELSECLLSGNVENLQEALSFYEKRMLRRASEAAKRSLENGERMHAENTLENMFAG